jgi:flagellar biosynthesis protein FlhB
MAEDDSEKTEDPTQKKLDDAHERGDVVKSQEVNTWFVLAGGTLVLMGFSGAMSSSLTTTFRGIMANAWRIPMDGRGLVRLTEKIGLEMLAALAVPFLLLALAALAGNLVQHRLVWSTEPITPKASKVSPMAGFKRLFGKIAMANFVKGLVKLLLMGAVMTFILWPKRHQLESFVTLDPLAILWVCKSLSLEIIGTVVAILAIIAAVDYLFQYRQWFNRLKMSVQELKEEYKQSEGDPAIKAKIRQLRQERSRKRMMAAVPTASVVITNPTHYAVALRYEKGMDAPECVAKGTDLIALKIREVAGAHDIPIVENPPLARALHATVDVDQVIPPEHYKAVAEVIGYVMRLKNATH